MARIRKFHYDYSMTDKSNSKDAETEGRTLGGCASTYDWFAATNRRARAVINAFTPSPGDRLLDVGCGTGSLCIALKEVAGPDGEAEGIDASARMVEVASRKAEKRGSGAKFTVAPIEKLPFGDSTFDKAYSTLMVHHLPPQTKLEGFREVLRVLKPGGGFLVVDFGPPPNWFYKVLYMPVWLSEKYLFSDFSSLKQHLKGEIPEVLLEAGFKDARILKVSYGILHYALAFK